MNERSQEYYPYTRSLLRIPDEKVTQRTLKTTGGVEDIIDHALTMESGYRDLIAYMLGDDRTPSTSTAEALNIDQSLFERGDGSTLQPIQSRAYSLPYLSPF